MAAMLMEAAAGDIEFKDGQFNIAGTDRSMALTDVAKAFYARPICRRSSMSGWKPPARSPPSRRTIRTAVTSARSRSIRRPAR